jgi:hypothetical protein
MPIRIEHRIGVAAPAEVIWEVLSDLSAWPEWNPMYPKVEGELRIGAALALTERVAEREQAIKAGVVDWVPDSQILWRSTRLGGWVKRLRYLEIDVLAETGCIFSNGEIWEGRYAGYAMTGGRGAYRRAFEALGEALKTRVEEVWAAKSDEDRARIERLAAIPPEPDPIPKAPNLPKMPGGYLRRKS